MIQISAHVENRAGEHQITLQTNNNTHSITIPPKARGMGSSANGGEILFLALATCYCNDIYREAAKRNMTVTSVHVDVIGEFNEAPGSVAQNVHYKAIVEAEASEEDIHDLMRHTDTVTEIQNSLRTMVDVTFDEPQAISV